MLTAAATATNATTATNNTDAATIATKPSPQVLLQRLNWLLQGLNWHSSQGRIRIVEMLPRTRSRWLEWFHNIGCVICQPG